MTAFFGWVVSGEVRNRDARAAGACGYSSGFRGFLAGWAEALRRPLFVAGAAVHSVLRLFRHRVHNACVRLGWGVVACLQRDHALSQSSAVRVGEERIRARQAAGRSPAWNATDCNVNTGGASQGFDRRAEAVCGPVVRPVGAISAPLKTVEKSRDATSGRGCLQGECPISRGCEVRQEGGDSERKG
jgi:hypothetical protein